MIKSCNLTEQDVKRLSELKVAMESTSESEIIRQAIRELHKKFLPSGLSMDSSATHPAPQN